VICMLRLGSNPGYVFLRIWEALTLGTIPVLEKGIGLDKTVRVALDR
jgi:hypothetical protein